MPYVRNRETLGFQRWVIGAYDKEQNANHVPWDMWVAAGYEPRNLGFRNDGQFGLELNA